MIIVFYHKFMLHVPFIVLILSVIILILSLLVMILSVIVFFFFLPNIDRHLTAISPDGK